MNKLKGLIFILLASTTIATTAKAAAGSDAKLLEDMEQLKADIAAAKHEAPGVTWENLTAAEREKSPVTREVLGYLITLTPATDDELDDLRKTKRDGLFSHTKTSVLMDIMETLYGNLDFVNMVHKHFNLPEILALEQTDSWFCKGGDKLSRCLKNLDLKALFQLMIDVVKNNDAALSKDKTIRGDIDLLLKIYAPGPDLIEEEALIAEKLDR